MNATEFAKLAMAIRTYYPRENILPTPESMEIWYREMSDIPYELAEIAVREWVHFNKWSPSIADIREQVTRLKVGELDDWGDGWRQLQMAIRRYGSYREVEALESLDELTRATVERLGYRSLCLSEEIEMDRANFRRVYETLAERKRRDESMPATLKRLAEKHRKRLDKFEDMEKKLLGRNGVKEE